MTFTIHVNDAETRSTLDRVLELFTPRRMALTVSEDLKRNFREQTAEAFGSERPPDDAGWPQLSPWRVEVRGNAHPILQETGSFADEVSRYKGQTELVGDAAFTYDFPAAREMSGRYWGLTAGQLVNPLGATPLAATPRRLLGGPARANADTVKALAEYFTANGLPVEVDA